MHHTRRHAARAALAALVTLSPTAPALSGCRGERGGDGPGAESFVGIELSALQLTRIRLVQERYAERTRALRQRVMPLVIESRRAWVRGDSAAAVAAWARSAADRAALRAIGDSMRVEIRRILREEQRPLFDRNVAEVLARTDDLDRRQGRPARRDSAVPR